MESVRPCCDKVGLGEEDFGLGLGDNVVDTERFMVTEIDQPGGLLEAVVDSDNPFPDDEDDGVTENVAFTNFDRLGMTDEVNVCGKVREDD